MPALNAAQVSITLPSPTPSHRLRAAEVALAEGNIPVCKQTCLDVLDSSAALHPVQRARTHVILAATDHAKAVDYLKAAVDIGEQQFKGIPGEQEFQIVLEAIKEVLDKARVLGLLMDPTKQLPEHRIENGTRTREKSKEKVQFDNEQSEAFET